MAKNIQATNVTKLMWRNSAGSHVLALNMATPRCQPVIAAINSSGTDYAGIGLLEQVNNSFRLELPNTASNIIGRARANSWAVYSSRRWKENITEIKDAIDVVSKLRGVEFDWKKDRGGNHDTSFIAEELEKVIPHAVFYDEDGQAGSIDATRIIPYIVSAMQEQQREIESLKADIASIKASLNNSPI